MHAEHFWLSAQVSRGVTEDGAVRAVPFPALQAWERQKLMYCNSSRKKRKKPPFTEVQQTFTSSLLHTFTHSIKTSKQLKCEKSTGPHIWMWQVRSRFLFRNLIWAWCRGRLAAFSHVCDTGALTCWAGCQNSVAFRDSGAEYLL